MPITQRNVQRDINWLVTWAKREAADPSQDWPGIPISQVPLSISASLRTAVEDGTLEIIKLPSSYVANRSVEYVVVVA